MASERPNFAEREDDGPECSNCGKTSCPDADLPEFSEPRECEFASMYEAFRASKDCDYGCGRDYSMQAVRLWMVPEMERIVAARLAARDTEPVEVGAYAQAMEAIRELRATTARQAQAHARTTRELRAAEAKMADLRAKVERVEALAEEWIAIRGSIRAMCGHDLRAALGGEHA